MAITREQIHAAADGLDAAGKPPTLSAVRKAVGGGSFTTIQDAMTEWKAKRQAKEAPIKEPAPQALIERLSEVGSEIWGMALQLANSRLAADREALEAERAQMEADRQEAADLADQLNEELVAAQARCADLERAERETAIRLNAALADVKESAESAARAETRVAEIELRAADLNAELVRVHEQNNALIAAVAKPADDTEKAVSRTQRRRT